MLKLRYSLLYHFIVLLMGVFLLAGKSYAVGAELVYDPYIYAKAVAQAKTLEDQLAQLQRSYDTLNDTYNTAENIRKDAEGHYGYGNLFNDASTVQNQLEWTQGSWDDSLHQLSGGNQARFNELKKIYAKDNPTLSEQDYQAGATADKAKNYRQDVNVNQAVKTQAGYEYENLQQLAKQVASLSKEIERTPNTKAAIDLNSRIQSLMASIAVEQLKMQVILNEQQGQLSADAISADTQAANFNRIETTH